MRGFRWYDEEKKIVEAEVYDVIHLSHTLM